MKTLPIISIFLLLLFICSPVYSLDNSSTNIKLDKKKEIIPILDIYFYLGMGAGGSNFSIVRDTNDRLASNAGFSSHLSSTIAWNIIGMRIEFLIHTLHNSNLLSRENQQAINGIGYFYILDITAGFHFYRKENLIDYHYVYTGIRIWDSQYGSEFNFLEKNQSNLHLQHGGYGWLVGYEFFKEFFYQSNMSFLLKIGFFFGSAPANHKTTNGQNVPFAVEKFSFTFGGIIGMGIKISNIQIILQYHYQQINTIAEVFSSTVGLETNFQIIVGYKL